MVGTLAFSEKSKKKRVRGVSVVKRTISSSKDSEMGGGSEGEEETQRIKPYRKTFYGCNSAVPRKQRSAMNKRSRESLSPPLPDAKKLHPSNGIEIESPQTKGSKKPKQNRKQGGFATRFPRQAVSCPITKDEEEVVETLYALAKTLPNDKLEKSSKDERASEPKSSPLQETRKTFMLASNATKEESMKSQCASTIAEATNLSSCIEGSPREIVKDNSFTKSNILEQPNIFASHKIDLPLVNSIPRADRERETLLPKREYLADPCKLVPGMEIKQSTQPELHHSQKQQNLSWPVTTVMMEQEPLQPIKDNKGSCTSIACEEEEGAPAFWPGFSMTESSGGRVQCPSAWSSSYKAPACLDSTMYTARSSSTGNIVPTKKRNSQFQLVIADRRKPWKRSTAHVYISHLILAGHNADKRAWWATPTVPLKATEGTSLGVKSTNGVTDLENRQDGAICSGGTKDMKEVLIAGSIGSSSKKKQNENPSGIIQEKGLQQDQHQASKTSRNHTSLNQSGDFLSESAGHGSIDSTTAYDYGNHGRNALESAQNVAPSLCSISQRHSPLIALSLPHAWYLSPPYPDILKMADRQQLQQLQYIDGLFYSTPQLGHGGLANQYDHQMMWTAKLASQSGSGIAISDFPKRQNGIDDFTLVPWSQPIIPHFSAPVDKLGTKLCSSPSPPQHLLVSSSSSSSKGKRQQQCLPSGYYLGGGLYAQDTSHLLCNSEHF